MLSERAPGPAGVEPRGMVTLNSQEREYKLGNKAESRSHEGCTLGYIK